VDIPKIKFTWDGVLHGSGYWNYFKCDKLCDGLEIDFYPNGQKRTEGQYRDGKPIHITEYRQNGLKENEFWYVAGTQYYTRAYYFDESGHLVEYELYKMKSKRKTVKTTYTAGGQKSGREVIRYTIVR
jgi:antitoxin component YwqK of YwqJK toxin-antitoxin module